MRTAKPHANASSSSSSSSFTSGLKKTAPAKSAKLLALNAPVHEDDMETDLGASVANKKRSGKDETSAPKRIKANPVRMTPKPVVSSDPGDEFDGITDEDLAVADAIASQMAQASQTATRAASVPSDDESAVPPHVVEEPPADEEGEPLVTEIPARLDELESVVSVEAPVGASAPVKQEQPQPPAAPSAAPMKTKSFDEYLAECFGAESDNRIYYKALDPAVQFTLDLKEDSPEQTKKLQADLEAKRAARKLIPAGHEGWWTTEDEDNYNAQKESAGRMLTLRLARGVKVSQVEWHKASNGRWSTSFLGRPLRRIPEALIMTPLAQFGFAKLGKHGDMFIPHKKKDASGNLVDAVKPRFTPVRLEDASYSLNIGDQAIDRPGYFNDDKRNPHMVEYFRFVRSELLKKGILEKMWDSTKLCLKIRGDVEVSLKLAMARELQEKNPGLGEAAAKAKLETDADLVAEMKNRFMKEVIGNRSTTMVTTDSTVDKYLGINVEKQYFKRPIFRRVGEKNADEQKEVLRKLEAGEYNHLPAEYIAVMEKSKGKLVYNHLLVFRHKTPAEMTPELWKKDPYPWIELTWEEREQITWATVGAVVYEVPLREYTPQKRAGPMSASTLFAVFIAAFDRRGGSQTARAARVETQRAPPDVIPVF